MPARSLWSSIAVAVGVGVGVAVAAVRCLGHLF